MTAHQQNDTRVLLWIGAFKLFKGLALAVLATGVLSIVHRDVATVVERWVNILRVDPENRHIAALLGKLDLVRDKQLKEIGALTFVYSALFLTEGIGLLRKKRWAEYLTVIATSSFVPLEIYEVSTHFSWWKVILLTANGAIVWFLVRNLKGRDSTLKGER